MKPPNGDGHTPTSALAPARCSCGAHLIVMCENSCGEPHPELGLVGEMDPIARVRAPRTEKDPRARRHRATKAPHMSAPNICARCGNAFPKTSGRQPRACHGCTQPGELERRAHRKVLNQKYQQQKREQKFGGGGTGMTHVSSVSQ